MKWTILLLLTASLFGQTSRPANITTTDTTKTNTFVGPVLFSNTATVNNAGVFNDTQVNAIDTANTNSLNFLTDFQIMQGSHGMTAAVLGGVSITNASAGIINAGVAGFANTNVTGGVGHPNALAFYGQTRCTVNNSDCFGQNLAITDQAGLTTGVLLNGSELDLDPQNNPSAYAGIVGFNGVFGPTVSGQDYANWAMFNVTRPAGNTNTIGVGYNTENGVADTGFQAGSACASGTCAGQPYISVALNSSAAAPAEWKADASGNFLVIPKSGSTLLVNASPVTLTIGTGNVTTAGTAVTNGTCQTQTNITVTGALTTDTVTANINAARPATWQTGIAYSAEITAANTVTVSLCNPTAGSITPVATQVNVTVRR